MKKLSEFLNTEKLEALIAEGYISRKFHNDYPLAILNYTPMAQYDEKLVWDKEMVWSRGLIYCTKTDEIVALPFPKFWNINDSRHPETMPENLPNETPLFLEKLDGSLGIIFEWDHLLHVATRGSFHSDQANWATRWIRAKYPRLSLMKEHTLLSEILFKENKIVIDYDFEGLVILGAIHKRTGVELSRSDLKAYCLATELPLVQEYKKSLVACLQEDEKNREGYVLTYPSTALKIKLKFETYCTLHRILTNLNVHGVWELLRDGKSTTIDEWLTDPIIPETFKTWIKNIWLNLTEQFKTIYNDTNHIYMNRPVLDPFMPYKESRKRMAMYFMNDENRRYSGFLFGLLDGKNIDASIWKMIEPSGSTVYRAEGE